MTDHHTVEWLLGGLERDFAAVRGDAFDGEHPIPDTNRQIDVSMLIECDPAIVILIDEKPCALCYNHVRMSERLETTTRRNHEAGTFPMSRWRRYAIEKFPHLHRTIADAEGANWVWFELRWALEKTYAQDPLEEKFVGDIYDYASWCLHHRSIEIRTAVVLNFYEALPENPLLRPDLARWISQDDFDLLEFTWHYVLKDNKTVAAFQQEFAVRKAEFEGRKSRKL
jgi:hypothetical protein